MPQPKNQDDATIQLHSCLWSSGDGAPPEGVALGEHDRQPARQSGRTQGLPLWKGRGGSQALQVVTRRVLKPLDVGRDQVRHFLDKFNFNFSSLLYFVHRAKHCNAITVCQNIYISSINFTDDLTLTGAIEFLPFDDSLSNDFLSTLFKLQSTSGVNASGKIWN